MIYACEAVLTLARYVILHSTGPGRRANLYNVVFILLSVTLAGIVVAIPRVRHRIWFGGDLFSARERTEQSRFAGPVKPFLVVVLPDGTIVTPRVAG
jgi:hypothetical protein